MLEKIKKIFCKQKNTKDNSDIITIIDEMFNSMNSDIITLLIGEDFVEFENIILDTITDYREELKNSTGFILPAVHVLSDYELQENEFILKARGKDIERVFAVPNQTEIKKEIKNALKNLYKNNLEEIFTYEIAEKYVNAVQKNLLWTIWNISSMYTITDIRNVLIQILKNDKSIKDINYIFEKFADYTLELESCNRLSPQKIAQKLCLLL